MSENKIRPAKLFKKKPRPFITRTIRLVNDESAMEVRGILIKEELYNPLKKEKYYESEYTLVDIINYEADKVQPKIIDHIHSHPSQTFYKEVEISDTQLDSYINGLPLFGQESDKLLLISHLDESIPTCLNNDSNTVE